MTDRPDDPAFPCEVDYNRQYPGMSLRCYIATAALWAVIQRRDEGTFADKAETACKFADSLLAELAKEGK